MTFEEYNERLTGYRNQIKKLEEDIDILKQKYIEEACPRKLYQKARIRKYVVRSKDYWDEGTNEWFDCVLTDIMVSESGNFRYSFKRINSKGGLSYFSNSGIYKEDIEWMDEFYQSK